MLGIPRNSGTLDATKVNDFMTTCSNTEGLPPQIEPSQPRQSLHIAYLTNQYPAVSHTFIYKEINELRKLDINVSTASINLCDRPPARLPDGERKAAESTFYVKSGGVLPVLRQSVRSLCRRPLASARGLWFTLRLGGSYKRLFYFAEALILGDWMWRSHLRHLHVHFGSAASSVAMIAARIFPITLSLTIHGPDEFYEVRKNYLKEKVEISRFVCCISNFTRSQLMKHSPTSEWHKLKLVPLGVDPAEFQPRPFRYDPSPFEIVCVGRLVPAKGQHILLRAFMRLVDQNRDVRLRFLGDGPDAASLKQMVAERGLNRQVIFEGAVNHERVRLALQDADVFALASFAEGVPVALMEAMAMEVPCVSTAIMGIPELLRHEIEGLLAPPSDDEQLFAALARLMDEPQLRRQLGRAGRNRVIQSYHLQDNTAKLAGIFQCNLQ